MKKKFSISSYSGLISVIISIMIGLLCGFIILLLCNPSQTLPAMKTLLCGSYDLYGFRRTTSRILYYSTPLIVCGEAVTIAMKCGKLNLGVSGQYWAGSFGAMCIAFYLAPYLGKSTWVVGLLASMLFGAAAAAIPGYLCSRRNVNIILSCLMMNYIATYIVDLILKNSSVMFDSTFSQTYMLPYEEAIIPKWGLDKLFPSIGAGANAGCIIAIILGIILWFVVNRSTYGFALKMSGTNPDAAEYAGVNEKNVILSAILISGAIGGLAGGLSSLSSATNYLQLSDQVTGIGFSGLLVGMLGLYNPIGVILSGLFMGYLQVGGNNLQIYGFSSEFIDIVISIILYASAFARVISTIIINRASNKTDKPEKGHVSISKNVLEGTVR